MDFFEFIFPYTEDGWRKIAKGFEVSWNTVMEFVTEKTILFKTKNTVAECSSKIKEFLALF